MTDDRSLRCIVCSFELEDVGIDAENQPNGGLACQSHGHYGSTAFDPIDGQYIEFNVCDRCLLDRAEGGYILQGRDRRPVICDGVIVGWEHVRRALVPWQPDLGEDDRDVVHVAPDEIHADEITTTHEGRVRIEWTVPKGWTPS